MRSRRHRSPVRASIGYTHQWASSVPSAAAVAVFVGLACADAARAGEISVDANIVTGVDISDSVNVEQVRLQFEGIARAVQSPDFIAAVRSGVAGKIGFAVFAWHHFQYSVVEWTAVASEDDAIAIAQRLEHPIPLNLEPRAGEDAPERGRFTDLSRAIDYGEAMIRNSPSPAQRKIINVIGNGADNWGEDVRSARERAIGSGAIVNGVVLGCASSVVEYYQHQVVGGPGSFVICAAGTPDIVEALQLKFNREIAVTDTLSPVTAANGSSKE